MEIAILIFDRLTALDAIGPYEVLSRIPGATVKFVAKEPGVVRTDVRKPPFDAGSPGKAPAAIVERLRSRSRFILS